MWVSVPTYINKFLRFDDVIILANFSYACWLYHALNNIDLKTTLIWKYFIDKQHLKLFSLIYTKHAWSEIGFCDICGNYNVINENRKFEKTFFALKFFLNMLESYWSWEVCFKHYQISNKKQQTYATIDAKKSFSSTYKKVNEFNYQHKSFQKQ